MYNFLNVKDTYDEEIDVTISTGEKFYVKITSMSEEEVKDYVKSYKEGFKGLNASSTDFDEYLEEFARIMTMIEAGMANSIRVEFRGKQDYVTGFFGDPEEELNEFLEKTYELSDDDLDMIIAEL